MAECDNCGSWISAAFERVMSTPDETIEECLEYVEAKNDLRGGLL